MIEYECEYCGTKFQEFQSNCPQCGGYQFKREDKYYPFIPDKFNSSAFATISTVSTVSTVSRKNEQG